MSTYNRVLDGMKKCPKCGKHLLRTPEFFGFNKATRDSMNAYCRICTGSRDYGIPKRKLVPEGSKLCSGCEGVYPASLEYFGIIKPKDGKHFFQSLCYSCELKRGRDKNKKIRKEVFEIYGGCPARCSCCGESEDSFLTLDHINGGGNKDRKINGTGGTHTYRRLKREGYPKGYQILCWNCNWSKHLLGACAHKEIGTE